MKRDYIIAGGGIVGLATALKLQQHAPGKRITVIEKETEVARHQTGHNSGVIHSGIYYKPGSLKATNCISGYRQLIDFANTHQIPYELCGKIIVATSERERPLLETLYQRGIENGLTGLKKLRKEELKAYEPHVAGIEGIHVPQTGIIDYKTVARTMASVFQSGGGELVLGNKVTDIRMTGSGTEVVTEKDTYTTNVLINCAGLYSDKLAKLTHPDLDIRIIPFRGEYYELNQDAQQLVKNLIYPVPDPDFPFLGVHFTRMIGGGVEAGPNAVLAFRREGYKKTDFNAGELAASLLWPGFQKVAAKYWRTGFGEMYRSWSKAAFTKALQKLIPEIKEAHLKPGGAGVRAQACHRNGKLLDDFFILESKGVINVCNAPSPAATSSLAIADEVVRRLKG